MTIFQKLFSVKNINIHKVITIFGIKLKFKSRRLQERAKFEQLNRQYKQIIQEYNNYKQSQIIDKQDADSLRGEVYKYPIDMNNNEPRIYTINWIKENAKVLDVGCACGELGEALKEYKNAEVVGLEYNTRSIEVAKQSGGYKDIIQCDLNKYKNIPLREEKFDYIVCGDVLEHIYEPQKVLNHLMQYLKDDGYFCISLPNIAHASIKANLLLNNFDYTPYGILDQTHIKFFTYKTIVKFLSELNLKIEECKLTTFWGINGSQPNNPYPEIPQEIIEFILKDKHSSIIQYVIKCRQSNSSDLININLERIQSELDKTPYTSGVEEYINI